MELHISILQIEMNYLLLVHFIEIHVLNELTSSISACAIETYFSRIAEYKYIFLFYFLLNFMMQIQISVLQVA